MNNGATLVAPVRAALPHPGPTGDHGTVTTSTHTSDVLVVGAGVIGLAHAVIALEQGLSVRIIERDAHAVGASVRNFGHACITAQADEEQDVALRSRAGWLRTAHRAGFWAREAGCVVVARTQAELDLLEQFRDHRGAEQANLLTASEVRDRLGPDASPRITGGAFLPADLRVDPRTTVSELAAWLARQPGVDLHWRTTLLGIDGTTVRTSRGDFEAQTIIVCVGHDLDQLYPEVADRWEIVRCRLQMMLTRPVADHRLESAVLSGTSMLRYDALASMPAAPAVRAALDAEHAHLVEMVANVMCTRRPDGSLLLGDTHEYGLAADPFQREQWSDALHREFEELLGRRLPIAQRWQGVYASSPLTNWVREPVGSHAVAVTVTSGIGMTMAFGVAEQTFDHLAVDHPA